MKKVNNKVTVYLGKISGVVDVCTYCVYVCVFTMTNQLELHFVLLKKPAIHPFWSLSKQSVKAHICMALRASEPFGHDPK